MHSDVANKQLESSDSPDDADHARTWVLWSIFLLLGIILVLISLLVSQPLSKHLFEATGAAVIGGCIAAFLIETRFYDRLIKRIANNLSHTLQRQHGNLLATLTTASNTEIAKLESLVKGKSEDILPMALWQLCEDTSPDAKLLSRMMNIAEAILKLKKNRSWADDVSLRLISELLFDVSENALRIATAREGGAHPIRLPLHAATLAAKLLATQMRLLKKGDEYVVLSDLSSWRDGLDEFLDATVEAVGRGVKVRRLICPFDHDEDLDEEVVRKMFDYHWKISNESQKDRDGMPLYELGAVRRSAAKHHRQLHHIGIFRRGEEGVKFEPQEPDLSVMRFERVKNEEPTYMTELWHLAKLSYRQAERGFEVVTSEAAWSALGGNWWK